MLEIARRAEISYLHVARRIQVGFVRSFLTMSVVGKVFVLTKACAYHATTTGMRG